MALLDVGGGHHTALDEGGHLAVDGLALCVQVSTRRKRFALTVEADATLTLHVPQGRALGEAEEFVRKHHNWAAAKIELREANMPAHPTKWLREGEVFRYLGRTYRLAITEEKPTSDKVRLVAGRLLIAPAQAAHSRSGREALVAWYCRAGHGWAMGRLQPWAARMSVPEPELNVCDLDRRWGHYSPSADGGRGRMSLGWQLFQLPMHLVDYVVAHELAHVRIAGHRVDFWKLLTSALPEAEERRSELDELGRRVWMGDIAEDRLST